MARIGRIFALEDAWRREPPETVKRLRNQHLRPHIEAFFTWAAVEYKKVRDQRGLLRSALGYAVRQKDALMRVLDDGRPILENNPSYAGPGIRGAISKTRVPDVFPEDHTFRFGRASLLREGRDLTLTGTGVTSSLLLESAELLVRKGLSARVLHVGSIAPVDSSAIEAAARDTGRIVVAEEHVVNGGLGGAVSEVVVRTCPVPVLLLVYYDPFGERVARVEDE